MFEKKSNIYIISSIFNYVYVIISINSFTINCYTFFNLKCNYLMIWLDSMNIPNEDATITLTMDTQCMSPRP